MEETNVQPSASQNILWVSIGILFIACIALYVLKEKEKALRITTQYRLTQAVEARQAVENNLAQAKKEITAKDKEIQRTLDTLEKETAARKEAEAQVASVTKEKQALEEKVAKLSAAPPKPVELEKIVVEPAPLHDPDPELSGRILAVHKEDGFMVVDIGSASNLKVGDTLSVYRDAAFIGDVRIEQVVENSAAVVASKQWENTEFKENDIVKKAGEPHN